METTGSLRLSVAVQEDHLASLVRTPLDGIAELIWNSLDADADRVDVVYGLNAINGIESVRVEDDGHGMTLSEITAVFDRLGGSWKALAEKSRGGRTLHGKRGQGRWRSLGIGGQRVVWDTVAEDDGRRMRTLVEIRRDGLRDVEISGPMPTEAAVGTVATVDGISENPPGLLDEGVRAKLTARFALHLLRYPSARIRVEGKALSTDEFVSSVTDLPLDVSGAELVLIEWKDAIKDHTLYLCDAEGVTLAELPSAPFPGYQYSAYLKSQVIRDLEDQLGLAALEPQGLAPLLDAARKALKVHFEARAADKAREVIRDWRDEEVYPFVGAPATEVESVKRQLFDVVAVTASPAINATRDARAKRLSLRLIEQALESEPAELRRILEEVLRLPRDQVEQLNSLLEHTTLTSIITASRRIADRLEFLRGLENLLFDPSMKAALKERSQLHKIVRTEPWIFGEEFSLAVDDRSLREVLEQHLTYLGSDVTASDEPVLDSDGRVRIVDLMFSGSMAQTRKRREHLVVELKRPSVKVGSEEIVQIEKYAYAVADNPRFNTTDVEWDFWVISDELDGYARQRASQDGLPRGMIGKARGGMLRIWAVQWGELLEDAGHRLKFVQDQLNYLVTDDAARAYLDRAHARYVPKASPEPAATATEH